MAACGVSTRPPASVQMPAGYFEPHWYALYTCANHEKRVAQQLQQRSIEHYLPLYEVVHRWKDRRMHLQLPLFPGYVFVRIALQDKLHALQVASVVHMVSSQGRPAALDDEEINTLRHGLASALRAEPHPCLTAGRRVRIVRGPLAGCEGILLRRKGNYRVVVSVQLILRAIAVDVDLADVSLHPSQNLRVVGASC